MNSIKINIVGDFCVRQFNNLHFGKALKKHLADSDINVVNLEGPILCEGAKSISKSGPHLYQDAGVPTFLEEHFFNAIALANNHIMDYGAESLLKTKKKFTKAKAFGAGTIEEAYSIQVFEVKNKKIGFLSLTQYEFGVLGYDQNSQDEIGSAWLCHPIVDELINNAKKSCDFLIIIPHAGLEFFEYPLPELKTMYRHYISMGADAVVGGHPHVAQCWEDYNGKPIIYSLGNFCFDSLSEKDESWYKGLMACLVIEKDMVNYRISPVSFDSKERYVDFSNDAAFAALLNNTNKTFRNEQAYIKIVNQKCLSLKNHYIGLFELSGFFRPTLKMLPRIILNTLKKQIRHTNGCYDSTHLINNLRCEPHRWVISRIHELEST